MTHTTEQSYYVYEVEYPEDGGQWFMATDEADAKSKYYEFTIGHPDDHDMLEALQVDTVEELEKIFAQMNKEATLYDPEH